MNSTTYYTGEPDAMKVARPVLREVVGKVPGSIVLPGNSSATYPTGVIGDVTAWSPSICLRVGHAGCFLDLNVDQVFELPEGLVLRERPSRKDE